MFSDAYCKLRVHLSNVSHFILQELTVDDVIRELKDVPGFTSYLILNNDGIVIKYENMDYKTALHHSHQVLGLTGKASKYIRDLFEANENEVYIRTAVEYVSSSYNTLIDTIILPFHFMLLLY